ncbi:MAG: oxidoreductase [Clostridia bacterium]|nr:oxidoreductase [Clostridia bacterium]
MKREINVGLIGYGMGSRVFHAPIIDSIPELKLYKVCVTTPENVKQLKEKFQYVQVVSTVDEILDDPNIELIVVATPNTVHYELAKRALEKGKNVVVEKPFTVTAEEADKLIALAESTKKLLTVHHNRRWDSDFKTVEKLVKSNLLGDIVDFDANYDRYRAELKNNWREKNVAGSGILYDLGSHLIDQVQILFGLPQEVFAHLEVQRSGAETTDYFKVILKYPNLKATLKSGMLVREPGPRFAIYGTKGSFIKYALDVQEEALKNGLLPRDVEGWGKEPEALWGKINTEANGLHIVGKVESESGDYREFYRNVYESILDKNKLIVKPQQARNTIRIIELAEQSHSQKRWVPFS